MMGQEAGAGQSTPRLQRDTDASDTPASWAIVADTPHLLPSAVASAHACLRNALTSSLS